MSDVAKSA